MKQPLVALVLAGTRAGGDPLAEHAGVSHKALIEVGGRTMIERVVSALTGVPEVGRIVVAIEQPALLDGLRALRPPQCAAAITVMPPAAGPSDTVAAALAHEGTPLLVTTADHALLQARWVHEFLERCPAQADVCVGLARRAAVEAAAPDTRRTWLRFADGDYSGCNLFLFAQPAAVRAAQLWRELESQRRSPLAMARRLGLGHALRYRLGRLTSADAAARLGELAGGVRVALVEIDDGRAAIDVDKPEDLVLVRRLVGSER